jgi:hypothetical protein
MFIENLAQSEPSVTRRAALRFERSNFVYARAKVILALDSTAKPT